MTCRPRAAGPRRCIHDCSTGTSSSVADTLPPSRYPSFLPKSCAAVFTLSAAPDDASRLVQIVLFQEFGPEFLRRSGNVRASLRREVHQIPIGPYRIEMISFQFGSPEMKDLSVELPEYMHHRPLHIIGLALAFVVGLIGRLRSRNQRHLRPLALCGPRIDPFDRLFGTSGTR